MSRRRLTVTLTLLRRTIPSLQRGTSTDPGTTRSDVEDEAPAGSGAPRSDSVADAAVGRARCRRSRDNASIDDLSTQLDELFDRWVQAYPDPVRDGFHRDGIVHEATYQSEDHRVLFVLLEPNSRGGAYDRYYGWDLRRVFGEEALSKSININLARWTRVLLDGCETMEQFDGRGAQSQIHRIAVMNLKKIAGSGTADYIRAAALAWQDRHFIREEVAIIRPTVVVACGERVNQLFRLVMSDDLHSRFSGKVSWRQPGFVVVPGNHPSLRPKDAPRAFERLVGVARSERVGGFV